MEDILSVGVDIGTSTTQVIFSRLTLENEAGYFSVPKVGIVRKQVVYKGGVHRTPLLDSFRLDGDKIRALVDGEFRAAGIRPQQVQTGAVIITGESARKENSALVLEKLSQLAGDFVVSTAGPDLEAILAGKGSGAYAYAQQHRCWTVNLDIGGGTSNIVLFGPDGSVQARGCVDIGGRQIQVDSGWNVLSCGPSAQAAAGAAGVTLTPGSRTSREALEAVCREMALLLLELVEGRTSTLLERVRTPGSSPYTPPGTPEAVFFSGGVADCVYHNQEDALAYGDIGVLLGRAIREEAGFRRYTIVTGEETIRATVVGAGTYTTSVSGSTISYSSEVLPQKNLPVFKMTREEQAACFAGQSGPLIQRVRWFLHQNDTEQILLALEGKRDPGYRELQQLAEAVAELAEQCLPPQSPFFLAVECDMAKALGQMLGRRLPHRPLVVVDSVHLEENEYLDLGRPALGGLVIPVVVKTLIFG